MNRTWILQEGDWVPGVKARHKGKDRRCFRCSLSFRNGFSVCESSQNKDIKTSKETKGKSRDPRRNTRERRERKDKKEKRKKKRNKKRKKTGQKTLFPSLSLFLSPPPLCTLCQLLSFRPLFFLNSFSLDVILKFCQLSLSYSGLDFKISSILDD
jgi:hypothetical protein